MRQATRDNLKLALKDVAAHFHQLLLQHRKIAETVLGLEVSVSTLTRRLRDLEEELRSEEGVAE